MINRSLVVTGLFYLAAALSTLVLLFIFIGGTSFDIHLPRVYEMDGLFSGSTIKTIIDTGWYLTNPYLGAPLTFSLADYPSSDWASFLIVKFIALFSDQYAVVMNVFYILTFPLVSVIALFGFRQLGLNRLFAFFAAALFTFLPYHFFRNEAHLFLNTYYVVPIYTLLMLDVFAVNTQRSMLKTAGMIVVCILAASSGVYYAFFACYLLLVSAALASLDQQAWRPFRKGLMWIAIIVVTVLVNTSPSIMASIKYGRNPEAAHRSDFAAENASLKIAQMLLPVDGHRIEVLDKRKQKYNNHAPLINENKTATLGLIAGFGFLFLLGVIFLKRAALNNEKLFNLSRLNLAALLFATIGGFSSLFAYWISPMMRSSNRLSVFIAFFSLAGFFIILQRYFDRRYMTEPMKYTGYAFLLVMIGLLDQVPGRGIQPDYAAIRTAFMTDQQFIAQIEKLLPANSMVFQLPVAPFPEYPAINGMNEYELFKAYLHARQTRWSYGAIQGRDVIAWQKQVSELPVKQMLDQLIYAGFSGIYINLDGYRTAEAAHLQRQLSVLLNERPLLSANRQLIFYDIRAYGDKLRRTETPAEFARRADSIKNMLLLKPAKKVA